MFSDHRCLHTKLNKAKAVKRKYLNLKKTDWAAFTKELDSLDWTFTPIACTTEVEKASEYFSSNVMEALKSATPYSYGNGSHRKESWLNQELCQMRRDIHTLSRQPS
jgi:hypothetical protein